MEIKIGIRETPRELVVSSNQSPDEVDALISDALGSADGILRLTDEKGRKFLVPAGRIAYVEIGPVDSRKVGFAVGG
ncbi:MAG: DUF3107 domain-containing protein [Haloechinothrix sp.]